MMATKQTLREPAVSLLLSGRQAAVSVLVGLVLWFVAAQTVSVLAPRGVFGGTRGIVTFALTLSFGPVLVWIMRRLAGLRNGQMTAAIALGTAAAALADGVAITWFQTLYAADPAHAALGAAWILWGAGAGLAYALWYDSRGTA